MVDTQEDQVGTPSASVSNPLQRRLRAALPLSTASQIQARTVSVCQDS